MQAQRPPCLGCFVESLPVEAERARALSGLFVAAFSAGMVVFLVAVVGEVGGPLDGSQWVVLALLVTAMLCHASLVSVVSCRALMNRPRIEVDHDVLRLVDDRVLVDPMVIRRDQVEQVTYGLRDARKDEFTLRPVREGAFRPGPNVQVRFAGELACPLARTGLTGAWVWSWLVFIRSGVSDPPRRG